MLAGTSTTKVYFRFKKDKTVVGETVRIVGGPESLGAWDPSKGLELDTHPELWPIWVSTKPVHLKSNEPFEYKYVKVQEGTDKVLKWVCPANRKVTPSGPEMVVEDDEGYLTGGPGDSARRLEVLRSLSHSNLRAVSPSDGYWAEEAKTRASDGYWAEEAKTHSCCGKCMGIFFIFMAFAPLLLMLAREICGAQVVAIEQKGLGFLQRIAPGNSAAEKVETDLSKDAHALSEEAELSSVQLKAEQNANKAEAALVTAKEQAKHASGTDATIAAQLVKSGEKQVQAYEQVKAQSAQHYQEVQQKEKEARYHVWALAVAWACAMLMFRFACGLCARCMGREPAHREVSKPEVSCMSPALQEKLLSSKGLVASHETVSRPYADNSMGA